MRTQSFKPDIFSLLKPRVCGRKTDEVIDKLGFQYSHRVEAVEFSGGIWISWKNTVNLEVIRNHPQFILVRICSSVSSQYVFIAFVYGSPNWRKRRLLWEQLKTTIPSASIPWLIIGDFNAILSSDEKKGGRSSGTTCS